MKEQTLRNHYKKMKFTKFEDFDLKPIESFPACQGYLLIELVKRYKIPFREMGYNGNVVCIKTKRQAMLWRDTGVGATFLGLINLESGTVEMKDDADKEANKDTKPFSSFKELNEEIKKRDYNQILGLKANITEEDYWYFLEVLPPLKMGGNWFILGEALSDNLYYKFTKNMCEVVAVEE